MSIPITTPSQDWQQLKREMLRRIEDINNATEWSEREPEWWTEMMDFYRKLTNTFTP